MRRFAGIQDAAKRYVDALGAIVASNTAAIATNSTAVAANATAISNLGTPVRADAAQSLTTGMIAQVLANLGVTYSIGSSGYINLFRLLILQWGGVSTGAGGSATWAYPTTFPNAVFRIFGTVAGGSGAAVAIPNASRSNSSAGLNATVAGGGNYSGAVDLFAIGW